MTTLRVEEGGRARTLAASDFPVPLGGPGSVVPVAASAGPLAWLGMADGEVFVQPAPGGAVLCNGVRLCRVALAVRRRRPAPRGHAGRGAPPGGRRPSRGRAARRFEPHGAARRARPPSARRAPRGRGRRGPGDHPDRLHAAGDRPEARPSAGRGRAHAAADRARRPLRRGRRCPLAGGHGRGGDHARAGDGVPARRLAHRAGRRPLPGLSRSLRARRGEDRDTAPSRCRWT